MKSRAHEREEAQVELFKVGLARIVDMSHEMVRLANAIDWKDFEKSFDTMWKDKGRRAIDTRLMVSLHDIKYTFDLSDEDRVESWVQNPYWQYLSGMRYFHHHSPIDPSSMSALAQTGRASRS